MRDFWFSCGHHLLDRDEAGRLLVTDAFLKAYLARPELLPPEDACEAELRLHHELLMHHPRRPVSADDIAAIRDADARENWEVMIAFRDRLLAAPSLEAAYLRMVRERVSVPSIFMNQLAQLVLRNALHGESDPMVLRAGELLFRPQRVTFHESAVLLADAETIEGHERDRHSSPLLAMLGGPAVTALDVLDPADADGYFERSDAFDTVLNLSGVGPARQGLAKAIAAWIAHLLGIRTRIEPVGSIQDADWAWFVGLDAEATRIGNALWTGAPLEQGDLDNVLAIFRLEFLDGKDVAPEVGARPVWLFLAMSPDKVVRMKPQNLIVGLPLRAADALS
jgi:hypothetical protein